MELPLVYRISPARPGVLARAARWLVPRVTIAPARHAAAGAQPAVLEVVDLWARELGLGWAELRRPAVGPLDGPVFDRLRLTVALGPLADLRDDLHDGVRVPWTTARALLAHRLDGGGADAVVTLEGRLAIKVVDDGRLLVAADAPPPAAARAAGARTSRAAWSERGEVELPADDSLASVDDEFWFYLATIVADGLPAPSLAGVRRVDGAERWVLLHRPEDVDGLRAGLRPRDLVGVFDTPLAPGAGVGDLGDDGPVALEDHLAMLRAGAEGEPAVLVWLDGAGAWEVARFGDGPRDAAAFDRIERAWRLGRWVGAYSGDFENSIGSFGCVGAVPDDDGVVRAAWVL